MILSGNYRRVWSIRHSHKKLWPSIVAIVLVACICRPADSRGQQNGISSTGPRASQFTAASDDRQSSPLTPGRFYSKELDLHFNYPVEMNLIDGSSEMDTGHFNLYGVSGDADPEHQEAKRCMRFLLDADLPQSKGPHRNADIAGMWIDDSEEDKKSRKDQPVFAQMFLVEIIRDCLPKPLQKREKDALRDIALSFVSVPGINRMPKPLWYDIGTQKIHMNSGVGRPIVNGKLACAPIIIMSMATQWHGHLLVWGFVSNDAETFNEMTKSLVQFGHGPWGPMFAANIGPNGSGTPITVLPK